MAARRAKKTTLVSVHMDLGAGRRGVDMGPSAIRAADLGPGLKKLGWRLDERGAVSVREPEEVQVGRANARYKSEVLDVCTRLRDATQRALEDGSHPIILGGDHAVAMGSIAGVSNHFHAKGESVGLIWIDAHTDMNVPDTTPSGNIHGMPLAHMLGYGMSAFRKLADRPGGAISPENVSLLGIRSVDPTEAPLVKKSGVRVYTMSEMDERGFATCLDEAIARASTGTAGIHLSFDLDGVDPHYAPGVGTPVEGGLTFREAHLACETIARSKKLLSMDMVELNPILDQSNQTGRLAVELILSAFGKTIL